MTAETPHPAEGRRLGPIDRADFITVRLPFVAPFGTSIHTWSVKEALLLRLEASGVVVNGRPRRLVLIQVRAALAHLRLLGGALNLGPVVEVRS